MFMFCLLIDWFVQQQEFEIEIQDMSTAELNKCLRKFYLSARKHDGGFYSKTSLVSIRAAIDRFLRDEPHNKPFSIIGSPEFTEANKALNSFLKTLSKSGDIRPTVHKNPLTREVIESLYEAGELVEATSQDPSKLQQTAWFYITLYLGRRGRENQRKFSKNSFRLSKIPLTGEEYFELAREQPGAVLATKNNQGGLDSTEDASDGKMFECKNSPRCPVAVLKTYLSHLNPKCDALFQKPLGGSKFLPTEQEVWYAAVPLGHNTIENMMKRMCQNAGVNPPYTNHCVRATTVNILSAKNMENRHIRAVTGHRSDSSLESYNSRPTFDQFREMSSAITEFVNPDRRVPLRSVDNRLNTAQHSFPTESRLENVQKNAATTNINIQENIAQARGLISGGSFTNCSFNFNFK